MSTNTRITYRKIVDSDRTYLLELYGSTRRDIQLHGGHLTQEEKAVFIKSQFELQDIHYKKFNPKADFLIVLKEGKKIGRLYKEELKDQVSVIEFTLHENVRSQNIGSKILNDMIDTAHANNKPVVLHAAINSAEFEFYKKLGFEISEDLGPYYKMTSQMPKAATSV